MPFKKPRTCKNSLNYDYLIHYMKHDAYPSSVKTESEKRNIRKRSKSFRLEQCNNEDKLYFIFTDDHEDNVTHEKEVVYKPEEQERVFNQYHINKKGVHLGREKLLNVISEKYYWPGICQGIKDFIKECETCRHKAELQTVRRYMSEGENRSLEVIGIVTKTEDEVGVEIPMESDLSGVSFSDSWITTQPVQYDPLHFWDMVEVKLLGPYSCNGRLKYVLVLMDVMSLWPEAAIVETISPTVVTHVLLNLICRFGVMNKLILQEAEDESNILVPPRTDILSAFGVDIEIKRGSILQTVPAWTEIEETMNHFVSSNPDWVNCVNFALLPHRISRGRQSEYSPAFLTYGRELKVPEHFTGQTTAEGLQTSDTYISVDKKIESVDLLMTVYKGYKGSVNISQDSDSLKTPSTSSRGRQASGPTPVRLTSAQDHVISDGRHASFSSDVNSAEINDREEQQMEVQIKQEIEDTIDVTSGGRTKRWSKTHRTSMDTSSNSGDLSTEELQTYRQLLEGSSEELMECDNKDTYYERLVLYLRDKKYAPAINTEHLKRGLRKAAERHYLDEDILYHRWRMSNRAVPIRLDERFYILEYFHIDSKGRHVSVRQMDEKLSNFYWKTMTVDCEAFVRSCPQCILTRTPSSDTVTTIDYNFNDEKRAKLAEENYSLLVKYLQKGKLGQTINSNRSQLIELLSKWFVIKSGQLFYHQPDKDQDVCVEIAARAQKNAIRNAHITKDSHASLSDTLQKLGEEYIWHGMKEACEEFVRTCCNLPLSKRNTMLLKYDLNQRMDQFHRLRLMAVDSKSTNKTSILTKDEVLTKYKEILNENDNVSKNEALDMSDSFVQTDLVDDDSVNGIETSDVMEDESRTTDKPSGTENTDSVEVTSTIPVGSSPITDVHGNHGDKTGTESRVLSTGTDNVKTMGDNSTGCGDFVNTQKTFSEALTKEHQYTSQAFTDSQGLVSDDGHGDQGLLSANSQPSVVEQSVGSKTDYRQTNQNHCKTPSDDATLSAVRSILPEGEDDDKVGVSVDEVQDLKDGGPGESKKDLLVEVKNIRYDNKSKYRCKWCGKCIKGAIRYRTHMYEHTGVKPFVCDFCPKRFTSMKTKKIHMLSHTSDKRFLCYLCGKGFSTDGSLRSHIAVHEKGGNVMVRCELCPRVFRTKNRYEKHLKFKHPYNPDVFRCNECDKNFTTRRSLVRHNKSQHQKVKGHICDTCGKGFYRKEYLKSHLMTHQPVRPQRPYVRKTSSDNTPAKYKHSEVHVQNSSPYSIDSVTETVVESITVPSDYTIPLTEGHHITLPNASQSHHIALPSTTVENQMTVESTYYIAHPDEENQVAHMLVYEQPAVQYEVECGDSGEQIDAAEALTAINILAQASMNQGY